MGISLRFWVLGLAFCLLFLAPVSFAETTCQKGNCEITITVKMAIAGADAAYINRAKAEIESFWNGPNNFRTVGDCKCKMTVKAAIIPTVDCRNNAPQGYHCITVTNFFKPDGTYDNPPRNQTNITGAAIYIGYVNGIATGNGNNSQGGWFSDLMSRPVNASNPGGPHYMDFAHEAGHLMGLDHNNDTGSIMNNTLVTQPNQGDLEGAAEAICGADYCPDRCCCGNGVKDDNKGENCDPKANPAGCAAGASCCPVCCNCYKPLCIAANGEYLSLADCQSSCGAGSACYKNYKTGCWDCVKQTVVLHQTCRDPMNIRGNVGCDHPVQTFGDDTVVLYQKDLSNAPVIGGVFANERINIKTAEGDGGHIVTENGQVKEYGAVLLDDPTVTIGTDQETIRLIAGGQMSAQQALSSGRIRIEGNDFFSGLRFGFYNFMFAAYDFFNPVEGFVPEPAGPEFPPEYYEEMGGIFEEPSAPSQPLEIGRTPDDGYYGKGPFPYE